MQKGAETESGDQNKYETKEVQESHLLYKSVKIEPLI